MIYRNYITVAKTRILFQLQNQIDKISDTTKKAMSSVKFTEFTNSQTMDDRKEEDRKFGM